MRTYPVYFHLNKGECNLFFIPGVVEIARNGEFIKYFRLLFFYTSFPGNCYLLTLYISITSYTFTTVFVRDIARARYSTVV